MKKKDQINKVSVFRNGMYIKKIEEYTGKIILIPIEIDKPGTKPLIVVQVAPPLRVYKPGEIGFNDIWSPHWLATNGTRFYEVMPAKIGQFGIINSFESDWKIVKSLSKNDRKKIREAIREWASGNSQGG